jgi:hypothetical protein
MIKRNISVNGHVDIRAVGMIVLMQSNVIKITVLSGGIYERIGNYLRPLWQEIK